MYVVQVKTIFAMSSDVLVLTRKKSHVTMYYSIHQTPSVESMTALDGATFNYKPSQQNNISSVSHFPFNPSVLIFFSHEVQLQ